MDKTSLIKRISTIEGLTNEERSALLGLLRSHKKYGLVWEDKVEDVEERLRDELPILREVKDKYIPSDAPDAPNHILIEGDNLEALTALSYTHEGKIDVIYIDPPYNTGNKDFVYNDSYVDSEDSYRHSKWLSFMNKRLKIAKRLLSDKGVIFISIDDNEQAQLKLLCDDVLGVDHFICNFIWKSRQNKDNRNISGVSIDHEYILSYCKTLGLRSFRGSERKTDNYSNPDNDPRGPWTSANMAGLATETAYEAVELLKALDLPVSEEQLAAISNLEKKYVRETVIPYVKKELEPFFSSFVNKTKMRIDFSPEEGLNISIVGDNRTTSNSILVDPSLEGKNRKKFSIDGGLPLNKRRFVLEVVRRYVESHPNITFDELERKFPSYLSNSPLNGVVRTYDSVLKRIKTQPDLKKRFLLEPEELITLSDGTKVTIYNQWGHEFGQFLQLAQQLFNVECVE